MKDLLMRAYCRELPECIYRDNGKENGNYYIIIGYILGLYWGYIIQDLRIKI